MAEQHEGKQGSGEVKVSKELEELAATAAGLKAVVTYQTADGLEQLRKICGGAGYLLNSIIGGAHSTFVWVVTAEGDYHVMLLFLARYILKVAQKVQKGYNPEGVFSYLKDLATFEDIEGEVPDLSDMATYLYLFKVRALQHVKEAALQMATAMGQGKNPMETWVSSQLQLLQAARSHCFYINCLVNMQAVAEIQEANCKTVLKQLYILNACSNILEDKWQGILPKHFYTAVQAKVLDLLTILRPNGVALVDAFDVPDHILNSTIGKYDGNVYESLVENARKSQLNSEEARDEFARVLAPYIDKEFLRKGNVWIPEGATRL